MPIRPLMLLASFLFMVLCGAATDQPPVKPREAQSKAAEPGKSPAKNAPASAPASRTSGVTVFVDPATGQIVEPTTEQLRSLAPAPDPSPKPKAPAVMIQGPGGAVGMVVPPEAYSYSVATVSADGKLALDCVTGDQAATRAVEGAARQTAKGKAPVDAKK